MKCLALNTYYNKFLFLIILINITCRAVSFAKDSLAIIVNQIFRLHTQIHWIIFANDRRMRILRSGR